jgi:hypothetical protein
MDDSKCKKSSCGSRGGSRPGCGRKPGIKTRPVRLPEWLLEELEKIDDPRVCIVKACKAQYGLTSPCSDSSHKSESHDQN